MAIGQKIDARTKQKIARLYVEQGLAVTTLAARFGIYKGTISKVLAEAGVVTQRTGRQVYADDGRRALPSEKTP